MKKYLSFLLMFSLAFVLVFSAFSKVDAASTTCKSPSSGRDAITGLSCSVISIPCPTSGFYEGTKEKCRQGQSTNTNSGGFALASTVTAKKGSGSATVNKTIQAILAALGFLNDKGVDGKYGNLTKKAVEAFQRSRGLAVDGKVGKDTLAALNKEIANPNVITLLKKFGTASAETPGTGTNGGSTGGAGSGGTGAIKGTGAVTSCPVNNITATTTSGVATITADNYYALYKVKGSTLELITKDLGCNGLSNCPTSIVGGTELPEVENFNIEAGTKLLVVQFADKNLPRNAVLAQFAYGGHHFDTNAGNWLTATTSIDSPNNPLEIGRAELESELKKAVFGAPVEVDGNDYDPYVMGIAASSKWISPSKDPNGKIVFFITNGAGVGALRDCGMETARACPYPQVGSGKYDKATDTFDCKWPASVPDLSPHKCGPSNLIGADGTCTVSSGGKYEVEAHLEFGPGRASIFPYDDGVWFTIYPSDNSTPAVTLTHDRPDPVPADVGETHMTFSYKPVAGVTIPANKFNGKLVPNLKSSGSGFFRNGNIFNLTPNVLAMIAILAPTVKCDIPTDTDLNISVTKMCGDGIMDFMVKFSAPVNVTGAPSGYIVEPDGTKGLTFTYLSGTGTNTLTFRHQYDATSTFVPEEAIGKFKFKLPLDGTIKTTSSVNVNLEGLWEAPNAPFCPVPVEVDSVGGSCRGIAFPALTETLSVTFNQEVTATTGAKVKINGAPADHGVVLTYIGHSGDNKTLSFSYAAPQIGTPDPNNYSYEDYHGDGTFSVTPDSVIKKSSNDSVVDFTGKKWNIPATIICPGSLVEVTGVEQMCTATANGFDDSMIVTFSEDVNVTGLPILKVDKTHGVELPYTAVSGNEVTFNYKTSVGNSGGFAVGDYSGSVIFKIPATYAGTIVSKLNAARSKLTGSWVPTGQACQ